MMQTWSQYIISNNITYGIYTMCFQCFYSVHLVLNIMFDIILMQPFDQVQFGKMPTPRLTNFYI